MSETLQVVAEAISPPPQPLPLTTDQIIEQRIEGLIAGAGPYIHDEKIESQPFTLYPNYVELKLGKLSKNISLLDFKGILDTLLQAETKLVMNALPYNCFVFASQILK